MHLSHATGFKEWATPAELQDGIGRNGWFVLYQNNEIPTRQSKASVLTVDEAVRDPEKEYLSSSNVVQRD